MRKKELLARLAEREAHIAQLEQRVQTMDGLIDGYHSREAAIVSALTHAHETAAEVIADAETRAKRILDDAGAAAESLRATAETDAARMTEEARRQSAQLLSRTEATVAEYETAIAAYNAGEGKIGRAKAGTGGKDFFEVKALGTGRFSVVFAF